MDPRGMAADQLLSAMGGGEAPMPPEEAGMGEEDAALAGEESAALDLESALAGVDAALEGMGESVVREIRTHLEAIRDIASREPGDEVEGQLADEASVPSDVPTEDVAPSPAMGEEQPL